MPYTPYEIIAKGLLLNLTGTPYKSYNQILLWVKKNNIPQTTRNGRKAYIITDEQINIHNEMVKVMIAYTK